VRDAPNLQIGDVLEQAGNEGLAISSCTRLRQGYIEPVVSQEITTSIAFDLAILASSPIRAQRGRSPRSNEQIDPTNNGSEFPQI
jgi:hypothetical protein